MKKQSPKPTMGELEILQVLWVKGPCTVRQVLDSMNKQKPLGYTGVLKLMQVMASKGLVSRDESERAHVYSATLPAQPAKRQLARDILQRVFGGSPSQFLMHALASRRSSPAEIAELRRVLDSYNEDENGSSH